MSKIMVSAANCLLHHHCSLFRNMIHNEKLSYVIFRDSTGYIKIMWGVQGCMGCMKKPYICSDRGGVKTPPCFKKYLVIFIHPIHPLYTLIMFMHTSVLILNHNMIHNEKLCTHPVHQCSVSTCKIVLCLI